MKCLLSIFFKRKKAGKTPAFIFNHFLNYFASTVTGTSLRSPRVKTPSEPFIATSFPASSAYLSPDAVSAFFNSVAFPSASVKVAVLPSSATTNVNSFPSSVLT